MTDNEPKEWEKAAVMEMRRRFPIMFKVANVSVDLGAIADISVVQTVETTDEDLLEYIRDNFIPKAEVRKVVAQKIAEAKREYQVLKIGLLNDLLRALHISDE